MEHTILIRFLIYMGGFILYIKGKGELRKIVSLWNFSLCICPFNSKLSLFSDKWSHLLTKVVLNLLNKIWIVLVKPQLPFQKLSGNMAVIPFVGQTLWWGSSRLRNIEEKSGHSVQNGIHIVFCSFKKIFCSVPCHQHKWINKCMDACMDEWMN